jgi:hypothetical protein
MNSRELGGRYGGATNGIVAALPGTGSYWIISKRSGPSNRAK